MSCQDFGSNTELTKHNPVRCEVLGGSDTSQHSTDQEWAQVSLTSRKGSSETDSAT